MKSVLVALALAIAVTTVAPGPADACGSYGPTRERAHGQWPSIPRADGAVQLELHYPKFARSGQHLYMDRFTVIADRTLARLERRLAGAVGWQVEVSVEEVAPGRWRVTGWRELPRA